MIKNKRKYLCTSIVIETSQYEEMEGRGGRDEKNNEKTQFRRLHSKGKVYRISKITKTQYNVLVVGFF